MLCSRLYPHPTATPMSIAYGSKKLLLKTVDKFSCESEIIFGAHGSV